MELIKAIEERRSIRKFTDEPVSEEQVTALLDAARLCQSAKNRQPWRFMVLRGKEKDMIAQTVLDVIEQKGTDIPGYTPTAPHSAKIIQRSQVVILVFVPHEDQWIIADGLSVGAAIDHITLRAVDLQLGCVWIRDTVCANQEIADYVGYPDLELISVLAIGHPAEIPGPRPRKQLEEIILEKR